jgi:hypothetical protein
MRKYCLGYLLVFFCLMPLSTLAQTKYILAVDEYVPAPGQFVNTLPEATADDTPETMAAKCTERLAGGAGQMVTLGAYGGYITFHFDHPIANVPGQNDFAVWGNANVNGAEPGIVMVSQDTNGNGLPDDVWYELAGSADTDSVGLVTYGYTLTYTRQGDLQDVPWTDNLGGNGSVLRNGFHKQEYFPLWLGNELTMSGTLLPANARNTNATAQNWVLSALRYGYADNVPNADSLANCFNLEWAVEPLTRQAVRLTQADFIRVYTGINQMCGWLGETSTEITGAEDLHLEASLQQAAAVRSVATPSQQAAQPYDLTGRKAKAGLTHSLLIKKGKKYFINH